MRGVPSVEDVECAGRQGLNREFGIEALEQPRDAFIVRVSVRTQVRSVFESPPGSGAWMSSVVVNSERSKCQFSASPCR